MSNDLTIRILQEIRDEARKTNKRLDQTNERLDLTNERLDLTNVRLVQVCDEMRHGFAALGQRVDNLLLGEHRREHQDLRDRVMRIEDHLDLTSG